MCHIQLQSLWITNIISHYEKFAVNRKVTSWCIVNGLQKNWKFSLLPSKIIIWVAMSTTDGFPAKSYIRLDGLNKANKIFRLKWCTLYMNKRRYHTFKKWVKELLRQETRSNPYRLRIRKKIYSIKCHFPLHIETSQLICCANLGYWIKHTDT